MLEVAERPISYGAAKITMCRGWDMKMRIVVGMSRWLPTEQQTRNFGASFVRLYIDCFFDQEIKCKIALHGQSRFEIQLVLAFLRLTQYIPRQGIE